MHGPGEWSRHWAILDQWCPRRLRQCDHVCPDARKIPFGPDHPRRL